MTEWENLAATVGERAADWESRQSVGIPVTEGRLSRESRLTLHCAGSRTK